MASDESPSIRCDVSTIFPSTFPANAAFARPGPIEAATSATDGGAANSLTLPSGKVILGMAYSRNKKVRGEPHFSGHNDVRSRVL
jgi:hypothetical protein